MKFASCLLVLSLLTGCASAQPHAFSAASHFNVADPTHGKGGIIDGDWGN